MPFISCARGRARSLSAALLLLGCTATAYGTDSYIPATRQLRIPTITIGSAIYSNMVVTVGSLISGPTGSSPIGSADSYDPASGHITVPAVTLGAATFYNVVAQVTGLVSIGSSTGIDIYSGASLTMPSITLGSTTYTNAVVTVAKVVSLGGGMPGIANSYDMATKELTLPAVQVPGGKIYTNVIIKIGTVISSGEQDASACWNPLQYNPESVSDLIYQGTAGQQTVTVEIQGKVYPATTFDGVTSLIPIQRMYFVNGKKTLIDTQYFFVSYPFVYKYDDVSTDVQSSTTTTTSYNPPVQSSFALFPGQSISTSGNVTITVDQSPPTMDTFSSLFSFVDQENVNTPAGTFLGACRGTDSEPIGNNPPNPTTAWLSRQGVPVQSNSGGVTLQLMPGSTFNQAPVTF
jgi:hypothetical protein